MGLCPQGCLCSGGLCAGGLCLVGVSVQGVYVQGGSLSRLVSVQGGLCLGGLCPGDLCPQGDLCAGRVSVQGGGSLSGRPPCMVKSGRYASYWNAFLLLILILKCWSLGETSAVYEVNVHNVQFDLSLPNSPIRVLKNWQMKEPGCEQTSLKPIRT